jgi:hypothetical protein
MLNVNNLKILTPNGFEPFTGVACNGEQPTIRILLDTGDEILTTSTHRLFLDGREIHARELDVGMWLDGECPNQIVSISEGETILVYDVLNVPSHTFYYNGIVSHNCEFISDEPLLFDTKVVAYISNNIEGLTPYGKLGDIAFFEQPKAGATYLVGMDPATGIGSDFTVIEVFDFPSMRQVAEWRSNTMSSPKAYKVLKQLILTLERVGATVFSVENNGVGEGVIALFEHDEHPFQGDFVSEDGASRLGMNTTGKSKMVACLDMKELFEKGMMTIQSPILIQEMKQYVRKGTSYQAKPGCTDDCISACLVVIRLIKHMSTYDQAAYDTMYAAGYTKDGIQQDQLTPHEEYDESDQGDCVVF